VQPVVDDDTQPGDTPVKRNKLFQAPEEKSAEEQAKMAETDMRCLSLCTAMLERVMSVGALLVRSCPITLRALSVQTFDENPTLDGILAELIIPAVKSKDPTVRERGIIALGLCCLIHRVCFYWVNLLWFADRMKTENGHQFFWPLH